jgi:hypothetical protein
VTLISVPERFAADALTREGEAARPWLARLPELVGELCVRWGLRVTGDPTHGYMALVVPVFRGDARYALKVLWVDDETVNEAAALALWNGGGAESGAMITTSHSLLIDVGHPLVAIREASWNTEGEYGRSTSL